MYERSVMLKHSKTHIVSRIFDTIHKMSSETSETEPASETACDTEEVSETITAPTYIVSVPNERSVLKFKKEKPFMICTYKVRTDGLYPFLLFLVKKTMDGETTFVRLHSKKQIKYAALAHMQAILPSAALSYAGFYETEQNNIIIIAAEETEMMHKGHDYIWATAFEIMNKKKIMNYTLDPVVLAFFLANPTFLILKDEQNRIYESPMVGYKRHENNCHENEMDIYRETRDPAFGKCYYLDREMPTTTDNIMRIAFFAGKMVLNREKSYDSFLCIKNHCYILQNYNQHIVLSVFKTS